MIRRPRRTAPAVLTALVLLAVGVLVAISSIQLIAGQIPLIDFAALGEAAGAVAWRSGIVLITAIVLAVIGLVLLAGALWPGRTHVLPLAPTGRSTAPTGSSNGSVADGGPVVVRAAGLHRNALTALLRSQARAVDGVARVSVTARRRQVRVTARTPYTDPAPVRAALADTLSTRLGALGLARTPRLRVRVTAGKDTA